MGILKGRNGREAMEIEELPFPAMDLRFPKFEQLSEGGIRGNLEFKLPIS